MQQVFVERPCVQGNLHRYHAKQTGIRPDKAFRKHGHQRRFGDNVQRLKIGGHREDNVASATFLAQPGINRVFGEFARHHGNVTRVQKAVTSQPLANWIASSDGTSITISKKMLLKEAFEPPRFAGHDGVNGPASRSRIEVEAVAVVKGGSGSQNPLR